MKENEITNCVEHDICSEKDVFLNKIVEAAEVLKKICVDEKRDISHDEFQELMKMYIYVNSNGRYILRKIIYGSSGENGGIVFPIAVIRDMSKRLCDKRKPSWEKFYWTKETYIDLPLSKSYTYHGEKLIDCCRNFYGESEPFISTIHKATNNVVFPSCKIRDNA